MLNSMIKIIKLLVIISPAVCSQVEQSWYDKLEEHPIITNWIKPYTSEGAFAEEDVFMDAEFNCTNFEDCSFNGRCAPSRTFCVCDRDFATFEPGNGPHCNYLRKKVLTALLLHLFLYNGVAHFYVQRLGIGYVLFFTVGWGIIGLVCFLFCCAMYTIFKDEDTGEVLGVCGICILVMSGLASLAIYIWLIVIIALNDLTDVNGVALKPV